MHELESISWVCLTEKVSNPELERSDVSSHAVNWCRADAPGRLGRAVRPGCTDVGLSPVWCSSIAHFCASEELWPESVDMTTNFPDCHRRHRPQTPDSTFG